MRRIGLASVLAAALAALALGGSPPPDMRLPAGESGSGDIAFDGEEDRVAVDLLAGTKLTFTAKPPKGSALHCGGDVLEPDEDVAALGAAKRTDVKGAVTIKNFVVPATGTWFVAVRGTPVGPTGVYDLTTKIKPAPNPAPAAGVLGAASTADVSVDGVAGTLLTVKIGRGKGSGLVPRIASIFDPDGAALDLTGVKRKESATSVQLTGVPLPAFGTYTVRIEGAAGTGGAYVATFTRKLPRASKTKRDLRGASGGLADSGAPASIEITPAQSAVAAGADAQLIARGTFAGGRVRDLTRSVAWSTRNRAAAAMTDTVAGKLTGVASGGTTAQAWMGPVEAREALVLVGGATVQAVAVGPDTRQLASGETIDLQAVATFTAGAGGTESADVARAADWAQIGDALNSVANGRAVGGAVAGSSEVTAAVGGVTSALRSVGVAGKRVVSIALTPAYAELTAGNPSRTFAATATYSDGTTGDVSVLATFRSDDLAAATMSGRTATRAGVGTAGIRATFRGVTSRPAVVNSGPVALVSLQVSGGGAVGRVATRDFSASALFIDGGTRDVTEAATWSSGTEAAATVSNASGARGRVRGDAAGDASISASFTAGGVSRSGAATANVTAPVTTSLRIVPAITTVGAGATAPFRVFATKSDFSVSDVTASATWTTSNAAVATVAGGDVTGVAAGGVVVRAQSDGKTVTAIALVGTGRLSALTLSLAQGGAAIGEDDAATTLPTFAPAVAGGTPIPLSAPPAFSDNPIGFAFTGDACLVRGTILAMLRTAFAGVESGLTVCTAQPAAPRSLTVFPQAAGVSFAADTQLAAQVLRSDGSVTDEAATASWTSLQTNFVTVNATGLTHAVLKGTATLQATASGLTGQGSVLVLGDPPTMTSVSPSTVLRGSTGNVLTINGAALDGMNAGVSFSGSGVTLTSGPTPNGTGSQATIVVDVSAGAATGARNLTYTTIVGQATLTSAFQVVVPAPTITATSPANIDVPVSGSTNTTLTVTGTNFTAGDTISLGTPTGVSLSNITVVTPTSMTATVTVLSTAPKTRLDVSVNQSLANGGNSATRFAALKIGPADPVITAMLPDHFLPGTDATGRISGSGFVAGISVTFEGSGTLGYTMSNVNRVSSSEITYAVTVSPNAAPRVIDVTLQNPTDVSSTFQDVLAIAPRDLTITSFSAASFARGVSNVDVTVLGTNFRTGATLAASGANVSFSSVTVVDTQTITAKASVSSGATTGLRDLTVAHAAGEGGRGDTLTGAFRVVDASPSVTSVNPAKVGRTGSGGATRRVPVTIAGTNFSQGATVTVTRSASSGLTVVASSARTASDTQVAFELDVAGTATTGFWDVLVTNPAGGGNSGTSGNGKLEIASETTLVVNRVIASSGSATGGERVTVHGAGFVRGCRVEFSAEKAPGVQFIDQNTLVCTVPAPANPSSSSATTLSRTAATVVDVKVTNNPGGAATSATLTGGYAYAADPRTFSIAAGVPALSATGVARNLKSSVLRMSAPVNTNTVVTGSTGGTHCRWFESGNPLVTGQTVAFGADRRFVVYSRTSTGNLPIAGTGKYILEMPTGVKSDSGAALTPVWVSSTTVDQWSFTLSASATDTTAPTVQSTSPSSGATGVATNAVVTIAFSEEVDPLTVTATNFQLKLSSTVIPCLIALSDDVKTVTMTPSEELAASTQYTLTVASSVADLYGNTLSALSQTFTTAGSDMTAPTIDAVVLADLPSSADGSTTYIPGPDDGNASGPSATAFDAYLPTSGWTVVVRFSDLGNGIDASTFTAKASVASGSTSANADLASKFDVTSTGARWTIAASDALTAGDDVTLTLNVSDKSGNAASAAVVTFDVVAADTTATGGAGTGGGDHDAFDTRETWVLRFDRDVYTCTFSTTGSAPNGTQQMTSAAGSDGVADVEQALRLNGLQSTNMTAESAATVNGSSRGTNAIVLRLFEERLRATLNARYGIGDDGSRGANAPNIEFLLPGEQGSLPGLPTWSSTPTQSSSNAYSEMDIGGDTVPNSSQQGTFNTLGRATFDLRNRAREANMNTASGSSNNGVFALNIFKSTANLTTGFDWHTHVLKTFQASKGGTPAGESTDDDEVLAGSFDRTSVSNSAAQNARYDALMDAIENSALSVSGVVAHEIGHSVGLVPDGGPKKGLFGNVHHTNAFTEATAGSGQNTTAHLDFLGNDVMAPASSVDDRTAAGTDLMRFSPLDRNYLLHRQVHDEGK